MPATTDSCPSGYTALPISCFFTLSHTFPHRGHSHISVSHLRNQLSEDSAEFVSSEKPVPLLAAGSYQPFFASDKFVSVDPVGA
jgi:hypothetical protein